jgi:hypothetical protein
MFTMKTEKFQLCGKNSVCTGAFQLLHGRASVQLRGNIGWHAVFFFQEMRVGIKGEKFAVESIVKQSFANGATSRTMYTRVKIFRTAGAVLEKRKFETFYFFLV